MTTKIEATRLEAEIDLWAVDHVTSAGTETYRHRIGTGFGENPVEAVNDCLCRQIENLQLMQKHIANGNCEVSEIRGGENG